MLEVKKNFLGWIWNFRQLSQIGLLIIEHIHIRHPSSIQILLHWIINPLLHEFIFSPDFEI